MSWISGARMKGCIRLRCGRCTRHRFCCACAQQRAAASRKKANAKYQRSDKGRRRHRAHSLAHYHRRGKDLRRQRRATPSAAQGSPRAESMRKVATASGDEASGERRANGRDGDGSAILSETRGVDSAIGIVGSDGCLTDKRVGAARQRWAKVGPARAVSGADVPTSPGREDAIDAKALAGSGSEKPGGFGVADRKSGSAPRGCAATDGTPFGPVFATVDQVRAALRRGQGVVGEGMVVLGRCARCGKVGRVVHFDGVLRAHSQAGRG
jgi:hypothetical protein